jgi:hypothetical protein
MIQECNLGFVGCECAGEPPDLPSCLSAGEGDLI